MPRFPLSGHKRETLLGSKILERVGHPFLSLSFLSGVNSARNPAFATILRRSVAQPLFGLFFRALFHHPRRSVCLPVYNASAGPIILFSRNFLPSGPSGSGFPFCFDAERTRKGFVQKNNNNSFDLPPFVCFSF